LAYPAVGPGALPLLPPHLGGELDVRSPGLDPDTSGPEPSAFEKLFQNTVVSTNERLEAADAAARDFASGKTDDIHGTMIAVTEADVELRLLGTMKNKVVEAFYELWRMQI
jgi:flagellar hook-basal body complex protein FliE